MELKIIVIMGKNKKHYRLFDWSSDKFTEHFEKIILMTGSEVNRVLMRDGEEFYVIPSGLYHDLVHLVKNKITFTSVN